MLLDLYKNLMCGSLGDLSIISFTPHKFITWDRGDDTTNKKKYFDYLLDLNILIGLKIKMIGIRVRFKFQNY